MDRIRPVLKSLLGDPTHVRTRRLEDRTALDIQGELLPLGIAGTRQAVCKGAGRVSEVPAGALGESGKESDRLSPRRRFQLDPYLEAAPSGTVQQLAVVGLADQDNVRRQSIDLEQQSGDHALNLAGLVARRPVP